MVASTRLASLLVLLALVSALVACDGSPSASPDPGIGPATRTATQPGGSGLTPSPGPTVAPSPQVHTEAATRSPTLEALPIELPAETVALVSMGSAEEPDLYALAADGSLTPLGLKVTETSIASPDGRWVARLEPVDPAHSVRLYNLLEGTTYTIPIAVDCGTGMCGRWAFDRDGARMAFLEMGAADTWTPHGHGWGIVVVNLEDGSIARFEAAGEDREYTRRPGFPLGWAATGELLLGTFLPFSEAWSYSILALSLPPGTEPAPLESLSPRRVPPGGSGPRLSPDGRRLLYLDRDPDYIPEDYACDFDVAVNQLWMVDVGDGSQELVVNVTDGGALDREAAWSPEGDRVLYAEGRYAGDPCSLYYGSLMLKVWNASGATREVGQLPQGWLQQQEWVVQLEWCRSDLALLTTAEGNRVYGLHMVDVAGGKVTLIASAPYISVLGCVR